jgi:diguanylate cyclase (GGDEF)-like protein
MRTFFFIVMIFCFSTVYSQETSVKVAVIQKNDSITNEAALLKQAQVITPQNPQDLENRLHLANQALQLSIYNKNDSVSAQSHSLLGEIALKQNKLELAVTHFLAAAIIYRDTKNKRYENSINHIVQLLPVAQKSGKSLSIANILINQADIDYDLKHYHEANEQYFNAIKYLDNPDKKVQKKLGETYKKIAQSYKRLIDREKTAFYYKKALDTFTAIDDKKNMARTLNTLAEAERYLDNLVVALDYSKQSLQIYEQINDPVGQAKALNGAGIIYRHIGRYEKSLDHIYRAYLYYKEVNDASGIAKTSNQMGFLYTRLKEFEQSRSFYQITIDLPKEEIDLKTRASALREIAVIDFNAGKYESAMTMIRQADSIYQETKNQSYLSLSSRIIGNIYREQQDETNAIAYYRKSLSIATAIGSKVYQIKAQLPLGMIIMDKNTNEAISLLKQALTLSTELKMKSYQLYAYRELRKAEKYNGNIAASLDYAEKEVALTKELQQEREDNELVLFKAKLYSHNMEMELSSLKEKAKYDQLELAKKNNEIEIASQARKISQLELTKNKYANFALACLLGLCFLAVIFIYRGFANSRRRNKELDYLATRDPLTNCYNRRILYDLLNRDFANLDLLNEYCIIMVDIDNFKAVNDTYGHIVGDIVLCGIAKLLQDNVRTKDTVTRFGGEEFCLVLPDTSQSQGMGLAEVIRQKVEASRIENIAITCSFGVTSIKFNAKSPTEMIHQADLALYKSKMNGRNLVTLWDSIDLSQPLNRPRP